MYPICPRAILKMMLMAKTYRRKRPFAEFVWSSYVKEARPLRWNAAAKVKWLSPTKNAPSNGLASKVTKPAMCAEKKFRICRSHCYVFKVSERGIPEQVEFSHWISMDTRCGRKFPCSSLSACLPTFVSLSSYWLEKWVPVQLRYRCHFLVSWVFWHP